MKVIVEIIEQKDGNVAVGIKTEGLSDMASTRKECLYAICIRDHLRSQLPAITKSFGGKDCIPLPGRPSLTKN